MKAFEEWWKLFLDIHFSNMVDLKCVPNTEEGRKITNEAMDDYKERYKVGWGAALRWILGEMNLEDLGLIRGTIREELKDA